MLITGAGGFAKEILSLIIQNTPDEKLVFFDDQHTEAPSVFYNKYAILHNLNDAKQYFSMQDRRFVLGVGNPIHRFEMNEKFLRAGGQLTGVISSSANISPLENIIGNGTVVFTHVVIEASNAIGKGCLLHHQVFVSHDIIIGNFCELSPAVNILGKVEIGNFCSIGTAAVILPGIRIGHNVIVGAGAVVTKNIPDNSVAVGIPAKVTRKLSPLPASCML